MSRYTGPLIDVDVHHSWKNDSLVAAYLPERWQQYAATETGQTIPLMPPAVSYGVFAPNSGRLADSFPVSGGPPGSDYETARVQLFDHHRYSRVVLTHDLGHFGTHLNPYFAAALCSAVNDWSIDNWLAKDKRLNSLVVMPSMVDEAVKEIYRVGANPQIVGVLFCGNAVGRPMGDPLFHPIFKAAADMGLAIAVHVNESDRPNSQTAFVGGVAGTAIQSISQKSQQAMHYISSLIVHGVFEKYPSIRVILNEFGVGWLPPLMWRLDQYYDLLKFESPWVKKWPSDYIRQHIRVSTQPFEESPDPDQMIAVLESVDGVEELLCFSTDYPHWSFDDPNYIARLLPSGWARKVFCDNACRLYGWDSPSIESAAETGLEELGVGSG